jgi:4-amino-4-deoxy-L-arabinose transferase-like glycosyltransferase
MDRRRFWRIELLAPDRLIFCAILLIALVVRLYGINFPLYHWDEILTFNDSFFAVSNNLAMSTFEHGSLLTYILLLIWYPIIFVVQGKFPGTFELLLTYYQNPLVLAVAGRAVSVLASTATVAFVYQFGSQLYNRAVGLLASSFLALTFLHVAESHYMRAYALTTCFSTLAVFFSFKILSDDRLRNYLLAGVSIGLATASQYSVILLLAPLLLAHLAAKRQQINRHSWRRLLSKNLLVGFDSAGIVFFLTTPYALINFTSFMGHMKWFFFNFANHAWVSAEGQPVWLFYVSEHLSGGMGPWLETIAILGVGYALYKHRAQEIVLLAFPLTLFLTLNSGPNFARYALPLLPFLCITGANLVHNVVGLATRRVPRAGMQLGLATVTVLLLIPSALNILRFDYWITQPDTRLLAAKWIAMNVPADAKLVTEGADILGPPIPMSTLILDESILTAEHNSLAEARLQAIEASRSGQLGYRVTNVFRLDQQYEGGIQVGTIPNVQFYVDAGIEYLVTVSWMKRTEQDRYSAEFERSLDTHYERIAEIRPTINFRYDPLAWRLDYAALSEVWPGRPELGGPTLTIYHRMERQ